jgi:photosystem II stability/assembly factor-like uncharacterized protein
MALRSTARRRLVLLVVGASALVMTLTAPRAVAGTASWTSAPLYGGTVFALAASPATPSLVLAGTGGAGVFRSTDGGASWTRSSSGLPSDTMVFALTFAPTAPDTVYAGTYASGVYRSTDAGQTWVRVTSSLDAGTFNYVAVDPQDAATVFIGSAGVGVWRSTDGGVTWTLLTLPGGVNLAGDALAIAASDPRIVYVVGSSMLRSADGGTTWTEMAPVTEAASVSVDPADADTILVGGMEGVFRSTDGGASWAQVETVPGDDVVITLQRDPAAPDTLWAGTYSSGLFRSDDGGSTWQPDDTGLPADQQVFGVAVSNTGPITAVTHLGVFRRVATATTWTSSSTGITGSQVNALAVAPTDSAILYAGLEGQGAFRSTDNGASWTYAGLTGQNVNSLAVSPTSASTIWAATSRGVQRSDNGGVTWATQLTFFNDTPTAVAVAPSSASTVYATTFQSGVYRSTDGGSTWHQLTLPGDVMAWSVLIDPTNPSTLWVGTRYAGIARSTDAGATWMSAQAQGSGADALALSLDPRNPTRLFAAIQGSGVYMSADSGQTWTRSTGGTPPNSATAVVADPSTAGRVYAGSDDPESPGVYVSNDDGVTWQDISSGLTTRVARSLAVQASGIVHLGTTAYGVSSGGGIFDYTPPGTAPSAPTLKSPTAPVQLASSTLVSWSGSDASSGVAQYQVRYQRAAYNAGFGAWVYPAGWQALPASTSKVTATGLVQGYDYCYSVRATDQAGNSSAWTPSRCTARALDDRTLSASTGWLRVTGSNWWNSTATTTTTAGARLTKSGVQLDQVGVVATTCNHCGSVAVYVGATKIGTISLYATATHYQRLLLLPRFSLRSGTVTIKVLSSSKTVQIDGLLSTRT